MNAFTSGFAWAAAVLGPLAWAAPAVAAAGGHLAYSAPSGCATQAEFEARVAERGAHFDGYAAPDAGRELRVSIARASNGFLGSFQTVEASGASAIREVHGATCPEVEAALVVVSAIALCGDDRPNTDAAPSADAAPNAEGPSVAPASPSPAAPTPASAIAVATKPEAPSGDGRLRATSEVGGSKRVEVGAGTLRFDLARSLTVLAGGELGLLPGKVLPRYDLSLSTANFVTTPAGKSYLTGVIPRLRVSYLGKASYEAPDRASVSAQGIGVALGLCWSPIYDTRGFVALLCSEYALGLMQLKSRGTATVPGIFAGSSQWARTQSPAFQTVGLSFDGEYHLGAFLHLALKVGLDVPIQAVAAERPDGSAIFRSSAFLGYGMLGLGFHR